MKSNSKTCRKAEIKKGPWTHEEDEILTSYIKRQGEGRWRTLPENAGLLRCGKSCRLRWMNYLRPNVKRGMITMEEEQLILRLHRLHGNRWSLIAGKIPGRTDNEIKNYWNTHMSKKLISQGVDPRTHMPLEPNPNPSQTYCLGSSSTTNGFNYYYTPNMLGLNQQVISDQYQVHVFDQNNQQIVGDQFSVMTQVSNEVSAGKDGDNQNDVISEGMMKGEYETYRENEREDVFKYCNNDETFSLFTNSLNDGTSYSMFPAYGTAAQQSYYLDVGASVDQQKVSF